mgnify:CR=1 FL=1
MDADSITAADNRTLHYLININTFIGNITIYQHYKLSKIIQNYQIKWWSWFYIFNVKRMHYFIKPPSFHSLFLISKNFAPGHFVVVKIIHHDSVVWRHVIFDVLFYTHIVNVNFCVLHNEFTLISLFRLINTHKRKNHIHNSICVPVYSCVIVWDLPVQLLAVR